MKIKKPEPKCEQLRCPCPKCGFTMFRSPVIPGEIFCGACDYWEGVKSFVDEEDKKHED